jgi:hypothetical protein
MKKLILIVTSILFTVCSFGQTNSFPADGNVGIGTNPLYKLHVQGHHGNSQILLHSLGGHTDERMADLFLWASEPGLTYSGAGIGNNVINASTAPFLRRINDARGGSYMRLLDGEIRLNIIRSDGYDLNAMTIKSSGNIGIGTNPSHKLSISSSDNQILELSSETSGTWMDFENTRASIGSRVWSIGHHGISGGFGIYQRDNTNEYRLFIDESGNIGIGTVYTKGFKLAVKGKIGAEEVQVKANYWSDFVFEDDYQLRDLEEVESFIEENKHLPDIPCEKEVLENGIQLGKMDAKLLQKIEELMLYTIQQEKKIKELQEIITRNGLK